MIDGEELLAEKDVTIHGRHAFNVRISHHDVEQFWRVKVTSQDARAASTSATVADRESFLMHLIDEALLDSSEAWDHLARWGHSAQSRPSSGLLPAV